MNRLEELQSYAILDTESELEMIEIAETAKAIFDTPASVVSFIDDHRQWYKSKIGVERSEVPLAETFCQFTLDCPDQILVILDPLHDERVSSNPSVTCSDGIRFYASAPIVSPSRNVLGTVCVWDSKRHQVQQTQVDALKLLAKRVALFLETKKILQRQDQTIELIGEKLKKLTDLSPGALFKLIVNPQDRTVKVDFLSEGITRLLPGTSAEEVLKDPERFLQKVAHPYKFKLLKRFILSNLAMTPFEMDIPIELRGGKKSWFWIKARPERVGFQINWYGTVQEMDYKIAHIISLKKILFDISHKMRAPVARIKGLVEMMSDEAQNGSMAEVDYLNYLNISADQIDSCLHTLTKEYGEMVSLISD